MLETARTVVMWNPSAGTAHDSAQVREALEAMPGVTLLEPGGREAAIEATKRAADDGTELIVAAGGDGTVSSITHGLIQADDPPVLGILPLGTGNDLPRSLGIPDAPLDALQTLISGKPTKLDIVEYDSSDGPRSYANMLTGGNSALYLEHMTDDIKDRWGPLCYFRGVIDVLRDLQTFEITVACDDGPAESFTALNFFLANGRFSGGGLAVSPGAELDDGQVDVVIIRDGDPGVLADLTAQYAFADYLKHELVVFRRAATVTISSQPELSLTADGDEIGETPLTVAVKPRCLRVLVPSSED